MSRFGENQKTMGKSRGDPEHALVFTGEFRAIPFAEGWRVFPQIHSYIENLSYGHTNEFALRMLYLIMQPAQNILAREGMVILNEPLFNSGLCYRAFTVSFEEKAAVVSEDFRFEQK